MTSTRPIAVLEILHFDLAFDGDAERGRVTIELRTFNEIITN